VYGPDQDLEYVLRIQGHVFQPWTFAAGDCAVVVEDPESGVRRIWNAKAVADRASAGTATLEL